MGANRPPFALLDQGRDRLDHQICLYTHVSCPRTTSILIPLQLETTPQRIPAAAKRRKSPRALLCKSPTFPQLRRAFRGNQLCLCSFLGQLPLCRGEDLLLRLDPANASPKSRSTRQQGPVSPQSHRPQVRLLGEKQLKEELDVNKTPSLNLLPEKDFAVSFPSAAACKVMMRSRVLAK